MPPSSEGRWPLSGWGGGCDALLLTRGEPQAVGTEKGVGCQPCLGAPRATAPSCLSSRHLWPPRPPCWESELVLGRTRALRARRNILEHPSSLCPSLTFLPSPSSRNFVLNCSARGGEGGRGREGRAQPLGPHTSGPHTSGVTLWPPGACVWAWSTEVEAPVHHPKSARLGGRPSLLRACPSPPPLETQQSQKTA